MITEKIQTLLNTCDLDYDADDFIKKSIGYGFGFAVGFGLFFAGFYLPWAIATGIIVFVLFQLSIYSLLVVTANKRISKMEEMLPDFLSLMSSNIKSGLTYDRALLLSAKKEFGSLSKEIDRAAKKAMTGTPFTEAFMDMTRRIPSESFSKSVRLIVEGVKSGGNLSYLLEITALDIRKFRTIRKEVAATVLVYRLFVAAAAALAAPLLYAVANFLTEIVADVKSKVALRAAHATAELPFFKGSTAIDPTLVLGFSLAALFITGFFGALAGGVISKGKESEGITYVPILVIGALLVFFIIKFLLDTFLKTTFVV